MVLDNIEASDLIRCACVSKQLREMVYDDTRWVHRLRLMDCWSESEARVNAEEARRRRVDCTSMKPSNVLGARMQAPTIFLNGPSPMSGLSIHNDADESSAGSEQQDGFDQAPLPSDLLGQSAIQAPATYAELVVLKDAQSVRGAARQEYGRIHAILDPYYRDMIRCKIPSNAKLFRVYRDPNQQARMLAQILRFSKADIAQGWNAREDQVGRAVGAFESAVRNEFNNGLEANDVGGRIKKYAHVLVSLNGGQSAIHAYLDQSSIFKNKEDLGNPMDCVSATHPGALFLEESQSFFKNLSSAFYTQCELIDEIFPPEADIMEPFVRRVGDEVFKPYLTTLLNNVKGRTSDAYIRAVPVTYVQSLHFLKTVTFAPRMSYDNPLPKIVDRVYALTIDSYLEDEKAFFKRRSDTEVTGWERQLSQQDSSLESLYMAGINRSADKRDFMSSFKKAVMAPVNIFSFGSKQLKGASGDDTIHIPSRSASRASRVSGRAASPVRPRPSTLARTVSNTSVMSRSSSPGAGYATDELEAKAAIMKSRLEGIKSLFSLEVALNLVHMAKTSIERAAVFARADGAFQRRARELCEEIFVLLLQTLGERHVRAGFDKAVGHLSNCSPRAVQQREDGVTLAPLVVFLELVNVGDLIQQMLDVFYEQELLAPCLSDRNDFLNATAKAKKRFEQMLDERVAAGLNKGIEVLMAEVEFICSTTQRVEDFNPGLLAASSSQALDVSPTRTAMSVVGVVGGHTQMLIGSTDKNILDVFNQEVGLRLFNTLCKHLKRLRISVPGAIRLIR